MIEIKGVTLGYGTREVISNFSASIPNGSIAAIVGRNGAGKSTLLAAIAGDIETTAGEIIIKGKAITQISSAELAATFSLAQQNHTYWMAYSVRDIIELGHESISPERFAFLVEALDVESFIDQPVTTLSGGQLQRVEIARSLMRDVPLVLLDEPFASQDLASIEKIKNLVLLESAAGKTFVIVTHAREEDLSWCNQIINLGA
jgi:ABC-type cobalamin/Fe3+-siderophores transport system ATPase subunit